MSYNVDELFSFRELLDGYAVEDYLKMNDPCVTELEIPAEYNGEPVTKIHEFTFYNSKYIKRVVIPPSVRDIDIGAFRSCKALESVVLFEGLEYISSDAFAMTALKSVRLPKSIEGLGELAFWGCAELERVEFNSNPKIGSNVFGNCPKLPPETVIMGLVCSTDITQPIPFLDYSLFEGGSIIDLANDCFRHDVFELLAKNNCFREYDLEKVYFRMAENNMPELFPIAEQYGMLLDAELLDILLNYAIRKQMVEITAYLLDHKNRKFGFDEGDNFEP